MAFSPDFKPPRELYPFESRYLDRNGLRLHYIDEGDGPAVLCVHGNPTWSFMYRDIVRRLAPSRRLVVPDHIGCGLSDRPSDDEYDFLYESRLRDLEALVEHTVPEGTVDLVVHDWGGAIGLGWAVRHPERVGRVVLFNTAAFFKPPGKRLPWQLWLARNTPLGSLLVLWFNAFAAGATRYCVTRRPLPGDVARAYVAPYSTPRARLATLRFVQDIPLEPGDPSYEAIEHTRKGLVALRDKPKLFLWGRKDFVFDDAFLDEWKRIFPSARYRVFEDAGHYVFEDARDEVLDAVESFLAADGRESACPEEVKER